jgi:CRP/FNR family transcriptional regulator, cyclic AMP receptor protein
MEDLDFSSPGNRPLPKPAPAPQPPKPVYNAAMALDFFRVAGKAEAVAAGAKFFEENEKGGFFHRDKMYLLLEGEVTLLAKGRIIGNVKIGEIFGEMGAISDSPRSATALAKTHCRVIAMDEKDFQKGLKAKPEFALMLMGMMIMRLRLMLARGAGPAAAAASQAGEARVFDKTMLNALAKGLGEDAVMRHGAGTVLFKEGTVGALAYVLLEGRVAVSIKGAVVEHVGPGGMFGEMALVDQSTRAATATAETDCALIAINRPVFLNLIKGNPEFGAALLGSVAERVRFVAGGGR